MKRIPVLVSLLFAFGLAQAVAQTCSSSSDLDAQTRTALESSVRQYQQDSAALRQNAEFNVGDLIEENKALFAGQATIRSLYLLDNTQPNGQRTEFYCGVYNTPDRVAFVFNSLPAGKYAVVLQNVSGTTQGMISWILRQAGTQWKVAGLYPKATVAAGHDGNWYLSQARAYRAKGQAHNAWFYYLLANDLLRPFPSMSTPGLDRLYDEIQAARPQDLPANGPMDLVAGSSTFRISDLFGAPAGDAVDLVVKYQTADISDSARTYQQNMAVIKALVAKYPELRDAFAGIVARAVAPNGQDYGTLLAMKDVK
jgi:hypothetical protein